MYVCMYVCMYVGRDILYIRLGYLIYGILLVELSGSRACLGTHSLKGPIKKCEYRGLNNYQHYGLGCRDNCQYSGSIFLI